MQVTNQLSESDNNLTVNKTICNRNNTRDVLVNFAITNARSLMPKIESFVEMFDELDLSLCVVSESWLKAGRELNLRMNDLENGNNLSMIHKSRKSNRGRNAGGGITIAFNKTKIKLQEYPIRKGKAEIIAATGRVPNIPRKVVVFGIYIPPKNTAKQSKEALELLSDGILKAKSEYEDPIIIIGGDFNRRELSLIHI